jgi:peroxiredoxin
VLVTTDTVDPAAFAEQTGWAIKPQGACKGEHCVPLPPEARDGAGDVVIGVVAGRLGMPLVVDVEHGLTAIGPESAVTGRMLTTAEAPDLELPTFDGGTFRLSDLRGTKVILVAWASWCGCAHDLPLWAQLRERLRPLGVEIVTVAMDTAGVEAGRAFVERAAPKHPATVDAAHSLGRLFGVVNVPSGVWIDEDGMIVRPAEPAFPGRVVIFEELKKADLETEATHAVGTLDKMREVLKSDDDGLKASTVSLVEMTRVIADNAEPELYLQMVLDWAEKGAASAYALATHEVVERSAPRSAEVSEAAAHFELGQHFERAGDHPAAVAHWRRAHELQPLNWTYKRQAWRFEYGAEGRPELYDSSMEQDLRTVGPENYYPKLQA